jgi:hypothetical protein
MRWLARVQHGYGLVDPALLYLLENYNGFGYRKMVSDTIYGVFQPVRRKVCCGRSLDPGCIKHVAPLSC